MSIRARVLVFIFVCMAVAVANRYGLQDPWPLVIAAVTYLVVVLPALAHKRTDEDRNQGR